MDSATHIFSRLEDILKDLDHWTLETHPIRSIFMDRYMIILEDFGHILWDVLSRIGKTAGVANTDFGAMFKIWEQNDRVVGEKIRSIGYDTLLEQQRTKLLTLRHQINGTCRRLTRRRSGIHRNALILPLGHLLVGTIEEEEEEEESMNELSNRNKLDLLMQIQGDISKKINICNNVVKARNVALRNLIDQKRLFGVMDRVQRALERELLSLSHSTSLLPQTGTAIVMDICATEVAAQHNCHDCCDSIDQLLRHVTCKQHEIARLEREIEASTGLMHQLFQREAQNGHGL